MGAYGARYENIQVIAQSVGMTIQYTLGCFVVPRTHRIQKEFGGDVLESDTLDEKIYRLAM